MNRFLVTTCVGALVAGSVAFASLQQSATLVLRSGSPLSGELVDLGGSGFTFRVNGEDRTIPRGDVESIDFGGGGDVPNEARNLAAGTNLLVLRNGDLVQGEFYDVGGTNPIRLTFRTSDGEREFPATEVRRVYMTRATGGGSGGGGTASQLPSTPSDSGAGRTVRVAANSAWTPTGITVRQGTTVRFDSSGEVTFAPNQTASTAGNGSNLRDSNAPLPDVLQGALVARIGATGRGGGKAFAIGNQRTVVMPASGQLFLGINDSGHGDNSGEFTVIIVAPR